MHLDHRLPHTPYIAAVLTELGDLVGPDTNAQYCDMGDDDVIWLEAFIDITADDSDHLSRPGVAWRQTDGWRIGDYDGRGTWENISPLPEAAGLLLPTPATIAAAVRRTIGLRDVQTVAADTQPIDGPLPENLQAAVDCGDLTQPLAACLAAYATVSA